MNRILTVFFIVSAVMAYSAETENVPFSAIVIDIDNYKMKTLVLNLRLKYIDRIFEKIVFYDSENADIEFDISGKEKRKLLGQNLINIHEGMIYRVKFTVIGSGTLGGVVGDLLEFTPAVLDVIPERGIK